MAYSLAEKLFANKPYSEPPSDVLGLKVEFKVPSGEDEDDIIRQVAPMSDSFLALLQLRKIPTLARAIRSIDGVPLEDFDEIKQRLSSEKPVDAASKRRLLAQAIEAELRKPEYTVEVITALHIAYSDFMERHRRSVEALKKTSIPPSPATAG